jgi:hypothetical protein
MSLVVNLSVGRLLSRNERMTTAKLNAIVKSIVIDISGSVGTSDLLPGAVTPDKMTNGAYFYAAPATFDGASTYTANYTPVITSYVDGLFLAFKVDTINPGAVNFNAGGGGKPLVKHGGLRQVDPGDLVLNGIAMVRFNTTLIAGGCWEVMSLVGRPVETTPFVGATPYLAGQAGIMPAPSAGQNEFYLRGDGTYQDVVTTLTAAFIKFDTNREVYKQQQFI